MLFTISVFAGGFLESLQSQYSDATKQADKWKKRYEKTKHSFEKHKREYRSVGVPENSFNLHKPLKNNTRLKEGIFKILNCDNVYDNDVLDSCYSNKNKGALAVAYTIDGRLVNVKNLKKRGVWQEDRRIPRIYRSQNSDYVHSGFNKGHMCFDSAFDYNRKVLQETYNLNINAVPQDPLVNKKEWIKAEFFAKKMSSRLGKVNIIDIVNYGKHPRKMGKNRISIPESFFKIVYNKKKDFMRCFYYQNKITIPVQDDRLEQHYIDCKKVIQAIR